MKKLLAFLFIALLLLSCQEKPQHKEQSSPGVALQKDTIELKNEIVKYPPSLVSSKTRIEIQFRDPIVSEHFVGNELDHNPFSFDPRIKGTATWLNTRLIVFNAETQLPPGKTVKGVFNGKIAFGEQAQVDDFEFTFKVAEQEIVNVTGDFAPVPEMQNVVQFAGVITFSQDIELDRLKKDLTIKGPSGKIDFDLKISGANNQVAVVTEKMNRTRQGKSLVFSLPKSYTADNNDWSYSFILAGIDEFRVVGDMDMSDPDSKLYTYGFRFNEPIKSNTDLSGFVRISPQVEHKLKIQSKYLQVNGAFVPGIEYQITITKGFPSIYGTLLKDDFTQKFSLDNIKPEIEWLSKGVYLPASNDFKLQFKSVNIARMDVKVYEIFPQNIGFFIQENLIKDKSLNSDPYGWDNEFRDINRVGETIYEKKLDITTQKNQWIKTEFDLGLILKNKKNSAFVVQLNFNKDDLTGRPVNRKNEIADNTLYFSGDDYYNNPTQYGYYYSRGNSNKLLISSNIGLAVKKAGDGVHVQAIDVLTAKPASGLKLTMYSYQNKPLETGTTNSSGYVFFKEKGSYLYGIDNSGIALVKLDHPGWEMNSFDIAGHAGSKSGIDAFMYTDRGVHRPGDTVHFSAIIRFDKKNPPENQPVILKVKNSRGQQVLERKTQCGPNGHVYFPIPTELTDPTGDWTAMLDIADQHFSKNLKIETIKPNRLKVYTDVPDFLSGRPIALKGTLTSKYLFGAPAANLKTRIEAVLTHKSLTSSSFPGFIFESPLKSFNQQFKNIIEKNLDDQGQTIINYTFDSLDRANALVRCSLHSTVYEKGGGFTDNFKIVTLSPFESYCGIKNVFEYGNASFGESYQIPIVAVDQEGNAVSGRKLKVETFVGQGHWWWHYDDEDRRNFKKASSTFKISTELYTSTNQPFNHSIKIEDYGRHYIEVTDEESGHQTGFFFYVSKWSRGVVAQETDERNFLQISSDQNVYKAGDTAELSFDTPSKGIAVLTIEQGNQVLHHEWKEISGNQTQFKIELNDEMVPNVYASIFIVQPQTQDDNDLPLRMYGVKPIYVENADSRLPLSLSVPESLEPKQDFSVKIHSNASKTSSVTIAIVDEGLLDITAFDTPSPWDYFYQKIMLAVQTLDNFDEIFGMLFPDMDQYFTIGGGMLEEARLKRMDKAQVKRFKPVVLFQEPIEIKPGETLESSFTMPNYVGSVKVMVVGTSGNSYVSLEETIPVKQPLMVLPTVPRVGRPGDTFDLPVTVFAMDERVRDVTVQLSTTSNMTVLDGASKKLTFTNIGDDAVNFKVKVGNRIGADTLIIKAISGEFSADYTVELPVSSPNPYYTDVLDTLLVKGADLVLAPKPFGYEGTNAAKLVFSKIPNLNVDERLQYLIRYPYGCLEQTVSSAFPQLFLDDLINVRDHQKSMITQNVNNAIERLASFKLSRGFSYWPLSSYYRYDYNDWATSYAGHFLILAKRKGYYVPDNLYNHWISSSKQMARTTNILNHRYQSYRLYLLSLAEKPDMGAMNLLRENNLDDLDPLSRKFLATAYYLAGQKEAAKQVDQSQWQIKPYREMGGTYGSDLRDRAMIAYLCLQMDDTKTASFILKKVFDGFSAKSWHSTQETAIVLLAASELYAKTPGNGGDVKFTVSVDGKKFKDVELQQAQQVLDISNALNKQITVTTKSSDPVYVSLQVEGIPVTDRIRTETQGILVDRKFYNEEGYPISVKDLEQGKSFWVIYKVKSEYVGTLEELALSSIFPAGWEIINHRVNGEELPQWVKKNNPASGDYMDIRDDRINWFFDLPKYREVVFAAHLNPTFKGTYRIPPVVVEAMYSPEYYARLAGDETVVK